MKLLTTETLTTRLISVIAASALTAVALAADKPKVVVLGFDGADYRMMDKLQKEGKLPNIAKLQASGTVMPLLPTNPAQTPVSWSAWATGKNPGKTEIFDFLKRDVGKYFPTFAMNEEKKKPFSIPILGHEVGRDGLVAIASGLLGLLLLALLMSSKHLRRRKAIALAVALAAAGIAYPLLANRADKLLPKQIPYAINNAKGESFWELAGKQGIRSRVIHVPDTFPARPAQNGQVLAGLGVPDMRGRVGTPSYYTDDPSLMTGDNEFSLEMIRLPIGGDEWDSEIFGPQNQLFYDKAKDPGRTGVDSDGNVKVIKRKLHIKRDKASRSVTVTPEGVLPLTVKEGAWSEWVTFDFPFNSLVKLKGFARFRLLSVDPLRLYLSPVNLHPENPIVFHHSPISQPPTYVSELYGRFGLFKTIGWAVDTWTLSSDLGDEQFFKEDYEFTVAKEVEIMQGLTSAGDVDLYVQVFEFTDRVAHLMWRLIDPQHPRYDAAKAAKYGDMIEKAYIKMDEIVGQGMALAGDQGLLIVSSDHGFTSFRRSMNYNTWLIKNGFMVVRDESHRVMTVEDLFSHKVDSFFIGVDWSRTKAYALGLGALYVNLQGREPEGSVAPADYEIVRQQLIEGLQSFVDPLTGEKPIFKVYKREEMYKGFDPGLIPDLRIANTENYRVSWQTSLGGFPAEMMQDNDKNWSGDHCSVEPSLVKGILLSNRKLTSTRPGGPEVIDVGPTILKKLGVPIPADVDGQPMN